MAQTLGLIDADKDGNIVDTYFKTVEDWEVNENNDGYERDEHSQREKNQNDPEEEGNLLTLCALSLANARRRDDEWKDTHSTEEDDEDEVIQESRIVEHPSKRQLRSATLAANFSSVTVADTVHQVQVPPNTFRCEKELLTSAIDEEHLELLQAYNQSVANLAKLRSHLIKIPHESGGLYLHLCEEAVLLQREAELKYLSTCDAYLAQEGRQSTYNCQPIDAEVRRVHKCKIIKGNVVIIGKDENGKWPRTELVDGWIQMALKGEKDQTFPADADFAILGDDDFQGGSTVKKFLRDLDGTCAVNNIGYSGLEAFLSCLHRHAPSFRCGLRKSKKGDGLVQGFRDYLVKDWRDVTIDVCPNNCILYVGEHGKAIMCPKEDCGEYRFSKCSNNGKCKNGGVNCDPFKTPTHNQRSSYQIIKYR